MPRIFDLGQVYQTGEAIKGARHENALLKADMERHARLTTLGDNPNATAEDYARASRPDIGNALIEARQFSEEEKLRNTIDLYRAAQSVVDAQDPVAQTRAIVPELISRGVLSGDIEQKLASSDGEQLRQAASQLAQRLRPFIPEEKPQDTGPLVPFVDSKTRQPVYGTRQQAIGQRPYEKPEGDPSSYEEFTRAQQNPEFAKFLQARRGKGLNVTLPDGTTISEGPQSLGPDELTTPIRSKLQETLVNSTNRLDRLNQTLSTYNPEFLRARGLVNATSIRAKDFLGMNISPDQRRYLDEYSQFQSTAATDLSLFLNELSGAAISPQEYQRLANAAPSGKESSPTEFEGKAKATVKGVTRAMMRANWALRNGIGVRSVEQLSKVMPLESIDQVFKQRANAIWQELGGGEDTRQQAVEEAKREFGLAQ